MYVDQHPDADPYCLQSAMFRVRMIAATKIQEAQKYYEQGMIEEIPQMLAPCMAEWIQPRTNH